MNPTQATSEIAAIILETVPDAYVRLDSELRFAFRNRAAETLLGAPRADLMGRTPWDVRPETAGTPLEVGFRRALAERSPVTFENYYETWQRWYALTATPDAAGGSISTFLRHYREQTKYRRTHDNGKCTAKIGGEVFKSISVKPRSNYNRGSR